MILFADSYINKTSFLNEGKDKTMVIKNLSGSPLKKKTRTEKESPSAGSASVLKTQIYVPKNLYMINGKFYEIYNDHLTPDYKNCSFVWDDFSSGLIDTVFSNKVRLYCTENGTYRLHLRIYRLNAEIADFVIKVTVLSAASETIYLLSLGDSMTNFCYWQAELVNMAANITTVGSRSREITDSDGNSRICNDDGRSGFASFDYINGTAYNGKSDSGGFESPNNFWYDPDNSVFSMSYYMANHFPADQNMPTCMTFYLGMNDFTVRNDTADEVLANIKVMLDAIRSCSSTLPVLVLTPALRYIPTLSCVEQLKFLDFFAKMEELVSTYEHMLFIPLAIGVDTTNNMNFTTTDLNPRNKAAIRFPDDITHPSKEGFWQMSDWILAGISQLFR